MFDFLKTMKVPPPVWKASASATNNGDFISIEAYSGYRSTFADPEATEQISTPDVSNDLLGKAVKTALQQSRFLSIEEDNKLYPISQENYPKWVKQTMQRQGYKTKKAMFRKMKSCGIQSFEGIITIRPSHHCQLEGWSGDGFTEDDYVKIPADSPLADIGAALRLAFSRCTSKWD